jgi:hypothetical protein
VHRQRLHRHRLRLCLPGSGSRRRGYLPDALAVAEHNVESHGLIHHVTPIRSDLFRDLPKLQYDLIVTNPPYVDEEDMADLPEEYEHEPGWVWPPVATA